ncbi:MAG: four helix bundle protein [Candidatus Omnitrophica bacterium]|nr:four helix bundle protein [Candidatus Omnitrophota bacterium]MBU2473273.1 four helix bundle protein [Candidatus Omnitrophota bacterium]
MEKIRNFRDLKIWQVGIEIVEDVYRLTKLFPRNEEFGLVTQMQRSSVSIPSNIAEGFGRRHNKEYKQFLYVAIGSCSELETQIEIAFRLKYILENTKDDLLEKINHTTRMIMNLLKLL